MRGTKAQEQVSHAARRVGRILPYAISICAGCILNAGCFNMSTGGDYGSVVTDGQKAGIVVGKTTKTDILRVLGNPDQRVDLGDGKEQFSYIKESIRVTGKSGLILPTSRIARASQYTEFWITFLNDVVTETGEQPTTKQPNYFK